ncbi:MAG: hypothetical protein WCP95_13645 [Actinomycetes bacterium]
MRATEQLGRYQLLDLVAQDPGVDDQLDVYLWHGYDEVLDRPVAIRVLSDADPRAAAVLGAAQAAAMVDDRRLLRVLDILNLPSSSDDPARIAVVSEWCSGRNLERTIQDRQGRPFSPVEALTLVSEVARALAAGTALNVSHGRLRPSSVFITDAGEVRIRGLAVDAALFGALPDTEDKSPTARAQGDVHSLGCLLYLLATGFWPGTQPISAPPAPQAGGTVLPPSQVRAAVPRSIDDVVARSVTSAARPRGVARVNDAAAFATIVGAALDHVAPIASAASIAPSSARRRTRSALVLVGRLLAVVVGLALVVGILYVGVQLIIGGGTKDAVAQPPSKGLLTEAAKPVEDSAVTGLETVFPISKYQSYDPFGDDNNNGKPDRRKGRESEEFAGTVNDADPNTAWVTSQYKSANLDGKPGVGLILDLGQARDVQQVSIKPVGIGTSVDVRVADSILGDPALWTPLAATSSSKDVIDLRSPRPVTGRYVLIWLTRLPPAPDAGPGIYQGGIKSVTVSG